MTARTRFRDAESGRGYYVVGPGQLDTSWAWADTAAAVLVAVAVAGRRWLFVAGFAAGAGLTAWRAVEMFRR